LGGAPDGFGRQRRQGHRGDGHRPAGDRRRRGPRGDGEDAGDRARGGQEDDGEDGGEQPTEGEATAHVPSLGRARARGPATVVPPSMGRSSGPSARPGRSVDPVRRGSARRRRDRA